MKPQPKRTEHGPRYENPNPGKGCNATHVARARRRWRDRVRRADRREAKRLLPSWVDEYHDLVSDEQDEVAAVRDAQLTSAIMRDIEECRQEIERAHFSDMPDAEERQVYFDYLDAMEAPYDYWDEWS